MLRYEKSAPIWLFSFVDLAFLLLIAFTQISPDRAESPIDLAEIEIPQIHGTGQAITLGEANSAWQLRVYPPTKSDAGLAPGASGPFALIEPEGVAQERSQAIDAEDLTAHLQLMRDRAIPKPILAPHRDSRSEDLLVAVSLLEDIWGRTRTVAVRPTPSVAAGPSGNQR